MKKIWGGIFFFFISIIGITQQLPPDHFESPGVKGNVREVIHIKTQPLLDSTIHTIVYTFNEKGKILSVISQKMTELYITNDTILYAYDEKGRLFRTFHYFIPYNAVIRDYSYDTSGNIFMESQKEQIKISYQYNEKGKIETTVVVSNNHSFGNRYTYDERGNVVTKQMINDSGEVLRTWYSHYSYTPEGKITECITENVRASHERDHVEQVFYRYNEKGNLVEKVTLDHNREILYTQQEAFNRKTDTDTEMLYLTYNEQGDATEVSEGNFGKIKSIIRYSYIYDSQGNWIEKETDYVIMGISNEIEYAGKGWPERREILYYP